ncbi:MAG TPA: iron-containing redox enzyme family protein [Puia sp.]|nr:iron-containing redox enzyme family protein [Puia sp.]
MNNTFKDTLAKHSLLQHPFYLAWNEGKLTREQLALYAGEYGSFIKLISKGWQQAGEQKIAEEEMEHYELWQKFAGSLGTHSIAANLPAVKNLVEETNNHYSNYPAALGALYAFEAQQPATASSKLEGLKKHYSTWNADETYFEIHATDFAEPALLEEKINALNENDKAIAHEACASTTKALWDALTGIMDAQKN